MRVAIHVLATLVVSVGALVSAGCVEGPDETAIDDAEEEEVGSAQQKIGGEAGCATVSLSSSVFGASTAAVNGATLRSPDDKYNPGTSCPNQYVAEFTGWNTASGLNLFANWDVPHINNSTECSQARLTVHYYGYNGSWNTTPTGEDRYNGTWVTFGTPRCDWDLVATSGSQPAHTNTKVRVAVFGYWPQASESGGPTSNDFKPVYVKVAP